MADLTGMLQAAAGAGGEGGWDISTAVYNGSPLNWYFPNIGSTLQAVIFKPDGTKMYIVGPDTVSEFNLSTAWEVGTASYLQQYSFIAQENNGHGGAFKDDGTVMYITGIASDAVLQYALSTPWDVTTASYTKSFVTGIFNPQSIAFRANGTKLFVIGATSAGLYEFALSTAWDVGTASLTRSTTAYTTEAGSPSSIFFRPTGSTLYILDGVAPDSVYEYALSTAWNISTISYTGRSFNVNQNLYEALPYGLAFKTDGTQMYVCGDTRDTVWAFTLSTAWNVSTASFVIPTTNFFDIRSFENQPRDVFFKPDGTKMYIVGIGGDDVNEFNLSTPWDLTTASYVQNFSVSGQDSTPTALFFKPDGTKMYVVGDAGNDVNEYNLSSAWDISTSSYLQNFSVGSQQSAPSGISFKDDGTKMYIVGTSADSVFEYSLSSAWNISTASYTQAFSFSAQEANCTAIFIGKAGTKMYIVGTTGDDVNEYNLSTAWDVSTASYVQNYGLRFLSIYSPNGIFFKPDGTIMYIINDQSVDGIYSFDLD